MASASTRAIGFQYLTMTIAITRAMKKTKGFRIKVDFGFSWAIARRFISLYRNMRSYYDIIICYHTTGYHNMVS